MKNDNKLIKKNVFSIRLAGQTIEVHSLYRYIRQYCSGYITDAPADFTVKTTQTDIDFERQKSAQEDEIEGIPVRQFSDAYLETLAVYRKIAGKLLNYNTLLFHGSCIAVDATGYLFTAASGTGKSTHTCLWRELFKERAVMVNDDKPLLKLTPKGITAYGTPWDGKHRLSSNIAVPLKAICILERDVNNHIHHISAEQAYPLLLQQSYRPEDREEMIKTLDLLDQLTSGTKLFSLGCNMEPDAASVSYNGMNGA